MITVIGLGFVGLTTALGFADKGYKVFGIDIDKDKVNQLKEGRVPFYEPGMDEALERNLGKNFILSGDIPQAVKNSSFIFVCVGTPFGNNGEAELKYVYGSIDQVLAGINDSDYKVLIIKSTIPPSTTQNKIIPYVNGKGFTVGKDIGVANNPEFLREGTSWLDFTNPDRIVAGTVDKRSEEMIEKLYRPFNAPIIFVSLNSAEYIKYLSNSLLATMISYSNEMSIIADRIGDIDVAKSFKVLHMDKRWNKCNMTSYVYPGCGYGGYCLPKDTQALYALSKLEGFEPPILKSVISTNEHMPNTILDRVKRNVNIEGNVGILGLSFKPNSDDVRDTPAAKIIRLLIESGYRNVYAYDPMATENFRNSYGFPINYVDSAEKIYDVCSHILILTSWEEFKKAKDSGKKIIDCRYMLEGV